MLEQLFGSRTRWKLLKLFLTQPERRFFIRELARLTGERLNSVRRELANLERWGLVNALTPEEKKTAKLKNGKVKKASSVASKKYYQARADFPLFKELKDLVLKSWLLVERSLAERLEKMGNVRLLILTGRFVGNPEGVTDVFIVGVLNREKLKKLMKSASRSFGEDIRYTIMTKKEYEYRRDITDRFLYAILEGKPVKVIDHISDK